MSKNISDYQYVLLGTKKKDGSVVHTPVWFAPNGSHYYVFSADNAGKVKRLKNFSEVTLTPCTVTGTIIGEAVAGNAILLHTGEETLSAHQALLKKYRWQMRLLDIGSKLSGKYHKRAFIKITL
jgi:uncharacterized protein